MFRKLSIFMLLALALSAFTVSAHEGAAHIRVGHFAKGAPGVDVYFDGESVLEAVEPAALTDFLEVEPGTISVAITPAGEDIDSAIFPAWDVTVEADHNYTISVIGQVDDDSLAPLVIDETAEMAGCDMSRSVFRIIINNVAGLPSLSFYEQDMWVEKNVEYGSYSAGCFPAFFWDTGKAVAGEDLDAILFDFDSEADGMGGFWEPYTVYFYALMGSYPGNPGEDYDFGGGVYYTVAPDALTFLSAFTGLGLTGDSELFFEFDTLVDAIRAAGLEETLADGAHTLFVPTDQAFEALPEGALDEWMSDPDALRDLLLNHIVEGDVTYDDLASGEPLTTLAGTEIVVGQPMDEEDFHFYLNADTRISDFSYPIEGGSRVWFIDNLSLLMPPDA